MMKLLPCNIRRGVLYVAFGAPSHSSDAFIQQPWLCRGAAALPSTNLKKKVEWSRQRAKAPDQEGASPSAILSKASTTRRPPAIYHIDRPNPQHSMSAPVSRALRRCVCAARPAMG